MRQLTDGTRQLTLAQAYEPFGDPRLAAGQDTTPYAFTGEWTDGAGLVHLRARYFAPNAGRFLQVDLWKGDSKRPSSYNHYLYAAANPVNLTDPSGRDPWWCDDRPDAMFCRANWIITNGGELSAEILRGVYEESPWESLMLLKYEFDIQLPPGYCFVYAVASSGVLEGLPAVGFELWLFEYTWAEYIDPTVIEFAVDRCSLLSATNPGVAERMDRSVYILGEAFFAFEFYPDDVASVMLHEAVHAWQEWQARQADPLETITIEWRVMHKRGLERQASEYVLQADESGRLDLSRMGREAHEDYISAHSGGLDSPFALPPGVP